jgi:hypothetical protein
VNQLAVVCIVAQAQFVYKKEYLGSTILTNLQREESIISPWGGIV